METNELALRQGMALTFDEMTRAAKAMALSGYFKDAADVSQAMVKVMAGAEMGLGPFAAMSNIHIIKGKPVLGANMIATLIKNDARYDYRIKRLDDEAAIVTFYEGGREVGESAFTMADARQAGLMSNPTWKNYPRNMLFARAISNGARWYAAGIFGGAAVYTPDEMGVDTDEDGYIEGEIVTAPATAPVQEQHVEWDDLEPAKPTNGNGKANGNGNASGPMPDDELVISETPAKGFIAASAALLGLDEEQVKAALKANGVTAVPRDTAKRLAAYRQLRSGVQEPATTTSHPKPAPRASHSRELTDDEKEAAQEGYGHW